jgi:hypothetical protein
LAAGAIWEYSELVLNGRRIRVVRCDGSVLSRVKARFRGEAHPLQEPDYVVCVGAHDDGGVPPDIVRAGTQSHLVRPELRGDWVTLETAVESLGLHR